MGPRRERRGNVNAGEAPRPVYMLQWGRVVKDAEIRFIACRGLSRTPTASMGPRRERRGNPASISLSP